MGRGRFCVMRRSLLCLQVMRDFCAEGAIKLGWDKVAVAGKSFPKDKDLTTNMLAEVFEAVWYALCSLAGVVQNHVEEQYMQIP